MHPSRTPEHTALAWTRRAAARLGRVLGPGFVSGAAGDDPSGIGTYAVAGARFGLATLWTALATLPMLAAAQLLAARVAMVSGAGLSRVLAERYRAPIPQLAVGLLAIANVLIIAADLGFLAELGQAILPLPVTAIAIISAAGILGLQIVGSYRFIANGLRLLALALLAYLATAALAHPNGGALLGASFVPTVTLDRSYLLIIVAIFGTTVSPYLFWWQAAAEVEEERFIGRATRLLRRGATREELGRSRLDVAIGAITSNLVMWAVIVTASETFHAAGQTELRGAVDAAGLLRPLAGDLAGILFGLGLVGSGRLAIPILSGATAYAVADLFGWRHGLGEPLSRAPGFYAVLAVALALAVALISFGVSALAGLVIASVINGFAAPALLALILVAARDSRVMGNQPVGGGCGSRGGPPSPSCRPPHSRLGSS